MLPAGYDPITLNHWLWFKYQCHEGTPSEFQRLFENVMKRSRPEFVSIRPYGKIGDRKCDGLYATDGAATVFQVYSPDELKLSETLSKIDEDLGGAARHWDGVMDSWTFVYNARRGLAADIPLLIHSKRAEYPKLTLDSLGGDQLWEIARGLTLQQRSEVLGAPAGYEHLFLSPGDDARAALDDGSFVIVQDLMSPISLRAVSEALAPGFSFGAPFYVRPTYADLPWEDAAVQQRSMVRELLERSRELVPSFSVFSLAPIPLAVHLGFVLSDRVDVRCYQFDRDERTWAWPGDASEAVGGISVEGVPDAAVENAPEVALLVSLSAHVSDEDAAAVAPDAIRVRISTPEPDVMWLRRPDQLRVLASTVRKVLADLRRKVPGCRRIHLLYAGPTGGAVTIGQQINPRMCPPVDLYQFSFQSEPRYRKALTLTEEIA